MPSKKIAILSVTVDLHGLTLSFQTPDAPLLARFEAIYGHLSHPNGPKAGARIEWRLHLPSPAPAPPPDAPVISEDRFVSYYGSPPRIHIRMPKYVLITVDLKRSRLTGLVTPNCLDVYGAFEDVLMISLAPLYRRRGWFPLHAFAALAPNGQAALITGQMGAGKTTTGLALLSAGWKLLSNDSPLLTIQDGMVHVLAYPGRLSAFDDSLARFEQLQRFIEAGPEIQRPHRGKEANRPGTTTTAIKSREKRVFRAEEAFDDPWASAGEAGGVFFPQVVPGLAQSELVEVAPTEAVLQLMPQAIEGWDKAAIGQNLQLLGRLVEQAPCYMLRLSPQVEQPPALIARGMERGR